MLTEDDVIDAVVDHLTARGWEIVSRCTVAQRGDDLVARRGGEQVVVEAKGAGSSKAGSARFGSTFTSGQVFDHVAKAVLKGLRVASLDEARGAIALPDDLHHRRWVEPVMPALARVDITVLWVGDDRSVTVDGHSFT
jgi:hypothetical protein